MHIVNGLNYLTLQERQHGESIIIFIESVVC